MCEAALFLCSARQGSARGRAAPSQGQWVSGWASGGEGGRCKGQGKGWFAERKGELWTRDSLSLTAERSERRLCPGQRRGGPGKWLQTREGLFFKYSLSATGASRVPGTPRLLKRRDAGTGHLGSSPGPCLLPHSPSPRPSSHLRLDFESFPAGGEVVAGLRHPKPLLFPLPRTPARPMPAGVTPAWSSGTCWGRAGL